MVDMKKYKAMRLAAIILSVVLFIFVAVFVWVMGSLYQAFYAQYAPNEGVWYCDKLNLTLSYESDTESYLVRGDEQILCIVSGYEQDKHVDIYAREYITQRDGKQSYRPGELLFTFKYIRLKPDYFIVRDDSGSRYTFIRLN